ncbi:hypothetical protein A2V68_00875 [candidate division Kazan bacterium RBG_13_50_9]|uniref:Uncharacterized protein n=1 Tax=candidate division Kazan bacterium RBG_13_50_9 TaxID=1798535 RepID=A0A1F4NSN0_UNCK3|nr:MAG: hypothetical protein A2V68_00875 [candidate division Kazan bacterium RBG_13_50_9]
MWRWLWLGLWIIWMTACQTSNPELPPEAGSGRLVKWSEQQAESHKKIVFIPGHVVTTDPHGLKPRELEGYFSPKLENLNYLGSELFGTATSQRVEFWLYGYQSQQDIAKIAEDVVEAIRTNSHFSNSLVAIVGYSQGGVVLWLVDQRYDAITGGAVVGAPILSTPLVHDEIRDRAVESIWPAASSLGVLRICRSAAQGTQQLTVAYPETGTPKTRLRFFAGYIEPHSVDVVQRNIDLLDALVAGGGNFLSGARTDRQLLELGAVVINATYWGEGDKFDRLSDGAVPVSSAIMGTDVSRVSLWPGYDHQELLSGKGELTLDREVLGWLGEVLDLYPRWIETDLPATPDKIELASDTKNVWEWAKFAYIQDGQLWLTDEDWQRNWQLPLRGVHSHPRAAASERALTWTWERGGLSDVCIWREGVVEPVSFDGKSRCASFSPNGRWLAYQSRESLVLHRLGTDQREVVLGGISLTAPPIWTTEGLAGRLYFVHHDSASGQDNLFWISPRVRDKPVSRANLVLADCGQPFQVKLVAGGVVAVKANRDSAGAIVQQSIVVVSGLARSHLSVDIKLADEMIISTDDAANYQISWDRPFGFEQAVFDPEYWHLYLVDASGTQPNIYLFDVQGFLMANEGANWRDIIYLVKSNASQLEVITPAP